MSHQHRGTFQYGKPRRVTDWDHRAQSAWVAALVLALGVTAYAMVTTWVLVSIELSHR